MIVLQLFSKWVWLNLIGFAVDRAQLQHSLLQISHHQKHLWTATATTVNGRQKSVSIKTDRVRNDCSDDALTACSRCVRAKSMFLVYCNSMLPSCRWVRASTLGGGLKLNTACRHWIHILIRFDVRKFSASPSSDRYQASCDDAIGREVIRELELLNKISFLTVTLHLSTIVIITKNCQQNTPNKNQGLLSIACNRGYHYLCILPWQRYCW